MAYQSLYYYTDIPKDLIDILEKDLTQYDKNLQDSVVGTNGAKGVVNKGIRNSKNTWIPTDHWIGGFVWHYVQKANRDNFLYDIDYIDGESMQYTNYSEGEYYGWHQDDGINTSYKPMSFSNRAGAGALASDFINTNVERVRKLSFSLLLSDPEDYEGGNFQLMSDDGGSYFAPRQRGVMVLFDSRSKHRVMKVTKGVRKSLVGWAVGPRWR